MPSPSQKGPYRAGLRHSASSGIAATDAAATFAIAVTRQLALAMAELVAVRAERVSADRNPRAVSNTTISRRSAPLRRLIDWLSKIRRASRLSRQRPRAAPPAAEAASQPRDLSSLKGMFRDQCRRELDEFLASGDRLSLPAAKEPRVSIVIVLFNQAELTLHCLRSLALEAGLEAEVVIVDNNSTDRTGALLDRLDGARVIRAPENLHFLRGVNRAAQDARGTYLLLLNNDTRVEPGAIAAAAARLDAEPSLGAVGGPIVMLDGTLQEAGCIIWNDGHTQGYGRGRHPGDWEFKFRRDVDYCSGAFLMVRRDLFERLGGLDTTYAPAYFEETDLCMRIREVGFRVGYEPAAGIVHFEYGSATTSDGARKLYTRNHKRFVVRHAAALASSHHAPGTSALIASMRDRSAGRVLIIATGGRSVLTAACRTIGQWVAKAMLDAGFAVTILRVKQDPGRSGGRRPRDAGERRARHRSGPGRELGTAAAAPRLLQHRRAPRSRAR
jgi:GT2 family glycosyltransferase